MVKGEQMYLIEFFHIEVVFIIEKRTNDDKCLLQKTDYVSVRHDCLSAAVMKPTGSVRS